MTLVTVDVHVTQQKGQKRSETAPINDPTTGSVVREIEITRGDKYFSKVLKPA